ncbi:glycoside hydrolase family 10 protein [Candidatus Latescibacterota bacterium]
MRALWVVRDCITSHEKVERLVGFADSLRFNVLFVQVRGRGDAYYKSYFAPPPENNPTIPEEFDPLDTVIQCAHKKGIEVHAWFNMYLTWSAPDVPSSAQHPLNRHPEWFMVSKKGDHMGRGPIESIVSERVEGRYLSPAIDSVRMYLSRIISEVIVNYAIDGVHLDYVRYPGRDYDFCGVIRNEYKRKFGVDLIDVIDGDQDIDPGLRFYEEWVHFRTHQIDRNVRDIARRIDLLDSDIRFSAAVKPHPDEAYYEFGQNWVGWLNEGIMDFVVPMSYYGENGMFDDVLKRSLNKVDKRKIISGIGIYTVNPSEAIRQVSLVRSKGLLGFCLFSYTTFEQEPRYRNHLSRILSSGNPGLPNDFQPYLRSIR